MLVFKRLSTFAVSASAGDPVPDFPLGASARTACAAFIKESRMKFANASKLDRKSGPATL
jgi:hypothetical protein